MCPSVSMCVSLRPSDSAGQVLSEFFSLHWISANTEHKCAPTQNSASVTAALQRFCSTPVLLQGGEVGQQAFMVELLQLQEVDGPLVWWGWQLKRTITLSPQGHKHTRPLYGEADRWQLPGRRQNTSGGKHTGVSPQGFESKHAQQA